MKFGDAITATIKYGSKVTRRAWKDEDKFVIVVRGSEEFVYPNSSYCDQDIVTPEGRVRIEPCFAIKVAKGDMQPGWVPTQADMFAEDWFIKHENGVKI